MSKERGILQKLKSRAKSKGLPYQLILQLFCQEEFLRRLSESEYRNKLILKGGLFLFSYSGYESRPTMDIDFLARELSNDRNEMEKVIEEILQVQTENDFISFDIDIGVGDVVVPEIKTINIPTQLKEFQQPIIASYSLESTIAEKLEAMFDRMELSSRMKDYYDIFYLASNYDFNCTILKEAIEKTFEKRATVCSRESLERISKIHTDPGMSQRWQAFTKRSLGVQLEFELVTQLIYQFAKTPIISIEEEGTDSSVWSKDMKSYVVR